jgi:hypothetical protein
MVDMEDRKDGVLLWGTDGMEEGGRELESRELS